MPHTAEYAIRSLRYFNVGSPLRFALFYYLMSARRIGQADQRKAGNPASNDCPADQSPRSHQEYTDLEKHFKLLAQVMRFVHSDDNAAVPLVNID
jgi:hypothetical protein